MGRGGGRESWILLQGVGISEANLACRSEARTKSPGGCPAEMVEVCFRHETFFRGEEDDADSSLLLRTAWEAAAGGGE